MPPTRPMGLPPAGRQQQCPITGCGVTNMSWGAVPPSQVTHSAQCPAWGSRHSSPGAPQHHCAHTMPHKNTCLASPCSQSSSRPGAGTLLHLLWLSVNLTCFQEILWPHQPGPSEATMLSGHSITGSSVLAWQGIFQLFDCSKFL